MANFLKNIYLTSTNSRILLYCYVILYQIMPKYYLTTATRSIWDLFNILL